MTTAEGPARSRWPSAAVWLLAEALLVLAILFTALGGRARDFRVPFQYSEDALEYLMQAQGTIQNGWWWTHPRLGAPGTFDQLSYPSNTNVDQAIVWLLHWFTAQPGLVVNLSWMLMVAVSSVVATACLRLVGISRLSSTVAGILFALLPYALSRNIEHFSLAIYLVPIPCAAALAVASSRVALSRRARVGLTLGCALVGFDYVYYAFFAAFLLLVATTTAAVRDRRAPGWRLGAAWTGTVIVATALNLAPSLLAWQHRGAPLIVPDKTPAESEMYGLKLRQLVSPVPDHPFPPFAEWATLERRAAFPLETENTTARLGGIASIGFGLLLVVLVVPPARRALADADLIVATAGLTLALILLATIGGFGSLFSLLISPAIRAYDRVCPFIAFFAWVAIGSLLDRVRPRPPLWRLVMAMVVVIVGTWDQVGALAPVDRAYAATRAEWTTVSEFVRALEPRLPPGAMVFQLPLTTYLNDEGLGRMRTYDEIKPYLASTSIRWSYPALDNAVVRWQHAVARLPPPAMAAALRAAGFAAVVIDGAGYSDGGASLVAALARPGETPPVIAEVPGYVALNLAHVAASPDGVEHLPAWTPAFAPASTGLPACAGPLTAHIDSVGGLKAPPSGPLTLARAQTYEARGWAVDDGHHALAGDVDILVDGHPIAAYYGVNRPDVAARASEPAYRYSGVLGTIDSSLLPVGAHRLAFRVVASDRGCAADLATLAVIVPPVF